LRVDMSSLGPSDLTEAKKVCRTIDHHCDLPPLNDGTHFSHYSMFLGCA